QEGAFVAHAIDVEKAAAVGSDGVERVVLVGVQFHLSGWPSRRFGPATLCRGRISGRPRGRSGGGKPLDLRYIIRARRRRTGVTDPQIRTHVRIIPAAPA